MLDLLFRFCLFVAHHHAASRHPQLFAACLDDCFRHQPAHHAVEDLGRDVAHAPAQFLAAHALGQRVLFLESFDQHHHTALDRFHRGTHNQRFAKSLDHRQFPQKRHDPGRGEAGASDRIRHSQARSSRREDARPQQVARRTVRFQFERVHIRRGRAAGRMVVQHHAAADGHQRRLPPQNEAVAGQQLRRFRQLDARQRRPRALCPTIQEHHSRQRLKRMRMKMRPHAPLE